MLLPRTATLVGGFGVRVASPSQRLLPQQRHDQKAGERDRRRDQVRRQTQQAIELLSEGLADYGVHTAPR